MKISTKYILKPKSLKIKKISLALRTFIGTISAGSYFTNNPDWAFWLLFSGAVIDFVMDMFENTDEPPTPEPTPEPPDHTDHP